MYHRLHIDDGILAAPRHAAVEARGGRDPSYGIDAEDYQRTIQRRDRTRLPVVGRVRHAQHAGVQGRFLADQRADLPRTHRGVAESRHDAWRAVGAGAQNPETGGCLEYLRSVDGGPGLTVRFHGLQPYRAGIPEVV